MRPPVRRLLRTLLWLAGTMTAGLIAGLAWEDFDRRSEPLEVAVGSPGNATTAGQDPTLVRGAQFALHQAG